LRDQKATSANDPIKSGIPRTDVAPAADATVRPRGFDHLRSVQVPARAGSQSFDAVVQQRPSLDLDADLVRMRSSFAGAEPWLKPGQSLVGPSCAHVRPVRGLGAHGVSGRACSCWKAPKIGSTALSYDAGFGTDPGSVVHLCAAVLGRPIGLRSTDRPTESSPTASSTG
jgi:hypothetical protein